MAKMWAGRTAGITDSYADELNSSIGVDQRMFRQDIRGSIAHAKMLKKQGIIAESDADQIVIGLEQILSDLESGALLIDEGAEDIHMFVEQVLTERIGDAGKTLHTARSRNDQVALDVRLYLRDEIAEIQEITRSLIAAVCDRAEEYAETIMPGYTHLQRAQPITFGHLLCAYAMMFLRDLERLSDCVKRINVSPIGSCAFAGTTYDTDRFYEAELLGFSDVCRNSIDGVSDRDFILELLSDLSILAMHLSRFSEEIVLFSSWEFKFIELSDEYTTGSSIMPQKKNPDMAELCRGKAGRIYGDLMAMLTIMKGLPLAYNKDMQEDKERVFDACDNVKLCLTVFTGMIRTLRAVPERMRTAAAGGFINATDLADYLVSRGLPFRSAYKISGEIVAYCIRENQTLESLPLPKYLEFSEAFDDSVYDAVNLERCVARRTSFGGTSPDSVRNQIAWVRSIIGD